jgi:uracil-DNA glycosylase
MIQMKTIQIITVSALIAFGAYSCKSSSNESKKEATTTTQEAHKKVVYTCSMHPEVVSDKPGACPKCGMELIVKQ